MTPTADLEVRRKRLVDRIAELQWDLGGLTYEMAIRDHFRLDVLVRVAAELQRLDGELGELERLLKLDEQGAAGACTACGALHGRGAVYCWQCGAQLLPKGPVTGAAIPGPEPEERALNR
jgi:hypothetical protein